MSQRSMKGQFLCLSLHGINVLGYDKLCVRAATNTAKPDDLSPTSTYIKYHRLR